LFVFVASIFIVSIAAFIWAVLEGTDGFPGRRFGKVGLFARIALCFLFLVCYGVGGADGDGAAAFIQLVLIDCLWVWFVFLLVVNIVVDSFLQVDIEPIKMFADIL
jgi:hypothetical protein